MGSVHGSRTARWDPEPAGPRPVPGRSARDVAQPLPAGTAGGPFTPRFMASKVLQDQARFASMDRGKLVFLFFVAFLPALPGRMHRLQMRGSNNRDG